MISHSCCLWPTPYVLVRAFLVWHERLYETPGRKHQRIAVLHHDCPNAPFGRPSCHLWASGERQIRTSAPHAAGLLPNLIFIQVVREIENQKTSPGDVPQSPVVISDCGELQPDDPSLTAQPVAAGGDGDPYEDWPDDEESAGDPHDPVVALKIAKDVREAANALFKKGDVGGAFAKYQSEFEIFLVSDR